MCKQVQCNYWPIAAPKATPKFPLLQRYIEIIETFFSEHEIDFFGTVIDKQAVQYTYRHFSE